MFHTFHRLSSDIWLGLNDIAAENDFEWRGVGPTSFTGGASGNNGGKDCCKFKAGNQDMQFKSCGEDHDIVCQGNYVLNQK